MTIHTGKYKKTIILGLISGGILMSPMVSPVRANRLDQLVERADINKGLIRHSLISPIVLETKSVRSGADVTPGNFLSYFNLQGSASYNQQTGVVTLTPDVKHKVGNITLKTKINVEQSFSLSGSINIGNKSQRQSGADGIGVGFLDGDPGLVGDDGGAIGLGGLPRSFGWKADTFFNVKAERFLADPRQFQGSPNVNVSGQGNAFGAFMRADSNGIVETYDGAGNEAAQKIAEPSNNTFKDFLMEYDGQTHIMTVKYDGKIWERNIFDWETNKNYAFFLSASTGAQTNLQQFKLKEFKYDATGVTKVRYVDDSDGGTDIINAEDFEGQVGTTENIKNKLDETNAKILSLNKGYSLIGVTKSAGTNYTDDGNLTYTLDQGEIVVHYERQQASPVTAKYVDTKGNPISEEIILQGKYGEAYTTEQKNITGWIFKEVQGVANGTYNGVAQEVSYIYQREEAAPVTVNYIDTNGVKVADSDVLNGRVDDEYTTNPKVVEGWILKITPENANGKFEKTSQSVDYVYERAEAAPITVNYVDEKGNKISDPVVLPTGKVGDKYETSGKDISGWVLKETPENANGTYGTEAQTVTYVYERAEAAPITVNYVDEKGSAISDPVVLPTGKVGDKYETSSKDIAGWVLKETPENANGIYGTEAQIVTYVYERAEAAPITVNYVDEKGNKISDPVVLPTGKVGDKYETSGKDITGWVLKETPENANGTYGTEAQTVTYVYERAEAAPITVNYVDEKGNAISDPDTLPTGKVGDKYETSGKDITGWVLKETPENANGTYGTEAQTVTYVYERAEAAPITVNYVDEKGSAISDPVVLPTGKVGDKYETSSKDIAGWVLKETPENANGIYGTEAQIVTYVYERAEAAPITVNYVDEKGNKISDPDTLPTGKVGDKYETSGKDITGWVLKETPENANGTYGTEAQTVTYVYERAEAAPITVNYVDEKGSAISDPVVLPTGKVGDKYETSSKDIAGWVLKETPENANGIYGTEAQIVTYVYERAEAAPITINYVDEKGNKISDPVVLPTGKVGDKYETSGKDITGWVLKETPENANGTYGTETQTVTYVYERAEAAPITINYVDEKGNKISDPDTLPTGKVGDKYETSGKDISGWVLKETPENANGTYGTKAQTVTYVYERAEAAPITVNYVDEKGNKISDPDTLPVGKVGDKYETSGKDIAGWVLKETPENVTGTYGTKAQTVTYVYERAEAAPITVNYVDEKGNAISDPVALPTGKVGDKYETSGKDIAGWVLKETPENVTGTYGTKAQTVTYVYERAEAAPITVNYVDEKGNAISDPVALPTGKVGDKYETSGKEITGWVLKETPENATGIYGTKAQTVTYVYERAEAAPITVNYVDEKGNAISDPDTLPTGKVGDKYETSGKEITGWVLKETPENATGTYGTKAQTVTYVYKNDKKPEVEPLEEGTVTVKYIDESGRSISSNIILIGKVGADYATSRQTISGYTFKKVHMDSAKESGKYVKGNLVVTYVYSKNTEPIVIGSVTVKYVDENQKEISPNIEMTGALGTTYKTNQQAIKGYKFKEMLAGSASETGKYMKNNLVVTYVYVKEETPVQIGTVTARYIDTTGRQISADINMTGVQGATYRTNQQVIKGYKFKEMLAGSASETGKYVKNNLVVTYVYVKEELPVSTGTVTARYIDTTGRQISADINMTGVQGATYKTNQQAIKGYKFKEILAGSASETGKYMKNNLVVTYVYDKEELPVSTGTVTARYVDVTGRQISADIKTTGAQGTTYKTNQQVVKGYTFKEMLAGSASTTGKYTNENQIITYVYVEYMKPIVNGTITVKYVDENGKALRTDVLMTGPVGSSYSVDREEIKGYTFKEIKNGSAETGGVYADNNLIVIYVYTKDLVNEVPKPEVPKPEVPKPEVIKPIKERLKVTEKTSKNIKVMGEVENKNKKNDTKTVQSKKVQKDKKQLPQTDEKANSVLTMMIGGLVAGLSLIGLFIKKRIKK